MAPVEPFDAEEFWEDLLAFIEDKRVLPIVGPELLTIDWNGKPALLYRVVAEALLTKYKLPEAAGTLRDNHELDDAVRALAASGKRVKDLYRPIHDILQHVLEGQTEPLQPLRDLASIRHFDLFATTTPDDLLARALNAVRFGGGGQTDEIEYAPKLPTDRRRDIPEVPSSQYTAVFHLFGKADASPTYAIHDEDALEFPYTLQAGNGPERMFSQLRSRNLLFLGCSFAEWLSRFFLRLANSERLFSDQRTKKEFLVGQKTAEDRDFVMFLERFSPDSRWYPTDARAFTAELYRRWSERNPAASAVPATGATQDQAAAGGSIFISYSSDDLEAAKKLLEGLQELGGDVAWFDKSALRPGDDWERHILGAIQRCSLFLPLVSANTERRTEGYFRLEWSEAADRARRIQGRKFIMPVVIDPNAGPMSGYALLPDRFRTFQFSHAPGGEMSEALRTEIREQLRILRRSRAS